MAVFKGFARSGIKDQASMGKGVSGIVVVVSCSKQCKLVMCGFCLGLGCNGVEGHAKVEAVFGAVPGPVGAWFAVVQCAASWQSNGRDGVGLL